MEVRLGQKPPSRFAEGTKDTDPSSSCVTSRVRGKPLDGAPAALAVGGDPTLTRRMVFREPEGWLGAGCGNWE
jgi:hypothetical protein